MGEATTQLIRIYETALLRKVLDMGITPRKFTQSRSLEKHFLEVTGGGAGD